MIVVERRYNVDEFEPMLAYDGEEEQLWGDPTMWESHVGYVGVSEEAFASLFDGPNLFAGEADEDPFADFPEPAKENLKNYPPGSEEIPDYETPEIETEEKNSVTSGTSGTGQSTYGGSGLDEEDEEEVKEAAKSALQEQWGGTGNGKAEASYPEVDDKLFQMQKRLVWWEADNPNPDLSKAPPVWTQDEDIPEFVKEVIRRVIDGDTVYNHFAGYSSQVAQAIQNSLEENLTQPQGWSISSLVEDLREMYPGMDVEQALNIARTETAAVLNSAREEAYEEREREDEFVYYWQGPSDHRTTEVCREIKEEVEARGGNVPMNELRAILREKARKYEDTAEGGTPERVDEWVPHYQCRHTFIRDAEAAL